MRALDGVGQRRPHADVTSCHEGDRRSSHRRDAARRISLARRKTGPYEASRQTLLVQPGRLVFADPRRQDLRFPGAGGRLEAFQLTQDSADGVGSFHAPIRGNALPFQQEAQEVARRDRRDLGPQTLDRVAMDSSEQTALAPFGFRFASRRESALHRETFSLQCGQRGVDRCAGQPDVAPERGRRHRAETLETAANDLDHGGLGG